MRVVFDPIIIIHFKCTTGRKERDMEQLGERYGDLFKFRIRQTLKDAAIRVRALLVKEFIFSDGLRYRYSLRYHGTATLYY